MVKRRKLLLETLDKLEKGQYTGGLDAHWCGNTITSLWKWRMISESEMNSLCDRVTALLTNGKHPTHI